MQTPDNYDMWEQHDREQERRLAMLPKCEKCGEPIQEEHCYMIDNELMCEECMEEWLEEHKILVDNM